MPHRPGPSLRRLAAVALLSLTRPACAEKPLDAASFDLKAAPCDDYYQYATGGWRNTHPIPPALPRWGAFDALSEGNLAKMRAVMDRLVATPDTSDADFPRIAAFYKSCLDEDRIERDGAAWLVTQLAPIDSLTTRADILMAIGRLQDEGISVFFDFGSSPDPNDSDREDAGLGQGGLSLPNRDYYTRDDERSKTLRAQFVSHVAKMFVLAGATSADADRDAKSVMDVETRLALVSFTPVELRDPLKNHHLMSVDSLHGLTPDFAWPAFFQAIGAPSFQQVDVGQPQFLKGLSDVLETIDEQSLKAYLRWHVIASAGDALPKRFVDERFQFTKLLTGAPELRPRWQRCLRETTAAMPDAVGKAFVKNLVPAGTKERVLAMVGNIRRELRQDIQTLDWMSPATRARAVDKLDHMTERMAWPDKWIDYSALSFADNPLYGDAMRAADRFEEHRDLAKIGKPTDHTEWHMSAMTTNAYYDTTDNSITFPAGILAPPFFDVNTDDAVNYGGIGAVIGHEMTHGFDDQGRQFDAKGNLADWWTADDAKRFDTLAQCIVGEYDGFVAVDDLHENGKLEAGEAIADLGGVAISHRAFRKTAEGKSTAAIDGMTPDQRFYAAFAQIWEQNIRPEQTRTQALGDPHPLAQFRVNGTLGNLRDFAHAYQCPAQAPMIRPKACKIW